MKDIEREWRNGYAVQASSELRVYQLLISRTGLPACHRLHYLQMCLEKTAKAYLWQSGKKSERSEKINTSHKYIGKFLPQIFRDYWLAQNPTKPFASVKWKRLKQLCQELDFLAPATDDAGQRSDNCEYPWLVDDGKGTPRVLVPALQHFPVLGLLEWTEAQALLKCVKHVLPTLIG
jgi:hypothetical protein